MKVPRGLRTGLGVFVWALVWVGGARTAAAPASNESFFVRGDADLSGAVELSDAVAILGHLFGGGAVACADAADTNDDGRIEISDPILLFQHLFLGGRPPASPYPECGLDPTPDALRCGATCTPRTGSVIANRLGMEFVYIGPGRFLMGSPPDEWGRPRSRTNEPCDGVQVSCLVRDETLHKVTLTYGFYMLRTEVTQGWFEEVMGYNNSPLASDRLRDRRPVTYVSWREAMAFAAKLGELDGNSYRLPTEAEWEYAARAGTQTSYWFGDVPEDVPLEKVGDYVWWRGNLRGSCTWRGSEKPPRCFAPVAGKLPNPWGLYDMHGNAPELVLDYYAPYPEGEVIDPAVTERPVQTNWPPRVLRGLAAVGVGGCGLPAGVNAYHSKIVAPFQSGRAAFRHLVPERERGHWGFRIVLETEPLYAPEFER